MKRIQVTEEQIKTFARGCQWNNPIAIAMKEQAFPSAREILVTPDEIYVDGCMVTPSLDMIRWMNRWEAGKSVEPMILGYYD
jgi:hypothetical protein